MIVLREAEFQKKNKQKKILSGQNNVKVGRKKNALLLMLAQITLKMLNDRRTRYNKTIRLNAQNNEQLTN